MEDERIAALMKYVRGEISFEQWIEIGGGGSGEAETEDIGLQDVEEVGREEESQGRAVESENKGETTGKLFDFNLYLLLKITLFLRSFDVMPHAIMSR